MKKLNTSKQVLANAATAVLTNPALWPCLAAFQCGLPRHFYPIVHAIRQLGRHQYVPHRFAAAEHFQTHSSCAYSTWFALYGLAAVARLHAECGDATIVFAAFIGHLPSLDYILSSCLELPNAMMELVWNYAARNGHLHLIEYLHQHRFQGCSAHVMDTAAANGHLDTVMFLHEFRGEGCTKDAMDAASLQGFLDIVQFLHLHRHEGCTKVAMTWAARLDKLQVVRFLSENRTEGCTKKALDWAAKRGHLSVVQYLHANRHEGCPDSAILEAAKEGHVDIVQYFGLHAGDAWLRRAMQRAVGSGQLSLVQMLVEQACCNVGIVHMGLNAAVDHGYQEIVHYLALWLSQVDGMTM
ncbi:unnamed protein product [Aphanomyces euteiches]|uniref:Ankyrin repeat-containing domain n=1 Tax=Aphanomyces euteiches TaxID=100861 RepID=A0A6G0W888_9STRA|nr:hypothetical protein Ae201684_017722 [Aphanomyces euteiches]KAH9154696.1 hypothetical protein AeRB84_003236 [Aphanomyces euteiches]